MIKGEVVERKKGKANRCILRSILLPEDFPSIQYKAISVLLSSDELHRVRTYKFVSSRSGRDKMKD